MKNLRSGVFLEWQDLIIHVLITLKCTPNSKSLLNPNVDSWCFKARLNNGVECLLLGMTKNQKI